MAKRTDAQRRNVRRREVRPTIPAGSSRLPLTMSAAGRRRWRGGFKGLPSVVDSTDANLVDGLEDRAFTFATETDAVGKMIRQTTPDGAVIAAFLRRRGTAPRRGRGNPARVQAAVLRQGDQLQRARTAGKIVYGNGVVTTFSFDRSDLRLSADCNPGGETAIRCRTGTTRSIRSEISLASRTGTHLCCSSITKDHQRRDIHLRRALPPDRSHRPGERRRDPRRASRRLERRTYSRTINPGDPLAMRSYTQRYRLRPRRQPAADEASGGG